MCSLITSFYCALFINSLLAQSEEVGGDVIARTALVERESGLIYCSGFMFNSYYMLTSCRCLFGFVAIKPYYRERQPEHYGVVSALYFSKMVKVANFVAHPFCILAEERKPFKHQFSAVVLKSHLFNHEIEHPLVPITDLDNYRSTIVNYSQQKLKCSVSGIHVVSGQHRFGITTMIIMTSDDCLRRICVPKIGCRGRREGLASGQDFCLKSIHDRRRKLRFLEGSDVICGGQIFGLVSHGGELRYPRVPVVFASITQYLESLPMQ